MHTYQHNIKTFNSATRHLTRVEQSLYRCLIELYYDTESPLTSDVSRLERLTIARDEEEKAALKSVLDEFFILTGNVYSHSYCDEVIAAYRGMTTAKAIAGKASAESRKKKAADLLTERTGVEQVLNRCSTDVQRNSTNQNQNQNQNYLSTESTVVVKEKKVDKIDYSGIIDLYHNILPELPSVSLLTDKRRVKIRTCSNIKSTYSSLEFWAAYFEAARKSNFIMGRNDPTTRKGIDFLVNPEYFVKLIEGFYS